MQPVMQIALAVFMAGKMPLAGAEIKPRANAFYCAGGAPRTRGS